MVMRFAWDQKKDKANRAKHKISFKLATTVFADPYASSEVDRVVDREERWQTVGMAAGIVILVVAHLVHEEEFEETIRIISARKATPKERRIYEQTAGF
jgi:uncharacterized DUF497 family protein